MEIKILGTVSPYCKDTKNCPGYLVTDGKNRILLDCGNGISRNLNLPDDLEDLSIIISHLHKDHYGELLSLGYATYVFHNLGYLPERIKVYIPEADYEKKLESYKDTDGCSASRLVNKPISDYMFLQEFGQEHYLEFITYKSTTELEIGDLKIDFSKNPHPINTHSIRVRQGQETFVYSADTGYKGNTLEKFALNANILLCESTFLKGQVRGEDNHLYAHEAAKIAKSANVESLVLTHFFPEINPEDYVAEARQIFENTEVASEGKILKIGGLK